MNPWKISLNNIKAMRDPTPLWQRAPTVTLPPQGHGVAQRAHAELEAIEAALVDGEMTDRGLAEHFGMRREHLRRRLRRLRDEGRIVERIEYQQRERTSWWHLP